MVSIEATERPLDPADGTPHRPVGVAVARSTPAAGRRVLPLAALAVIFLTALVARLLASDVVITADEDNWMRRAGGFTYGLLNGQFGRTYQNGHPGVTTMWVAMLTLGPERMVQYADRVHNQRLVGRVAGFWDALVDARPGFALVTAALTTLIAGLTWRLFGPLVGLLAGLLVGLEPFFLAISQLVHMDAMLSGCMVASVLAALVAWTRGGGRGWLVASGILAGLAILSKVPAIFLLAFVPALGIGLHVLRSIADIGTDHLASHCQPKHVQDQPNCVHCHPERSEGSPNLNGLFGRSFAALRMTGWATGMTGLALRPTGGALRHLLTDLVVWGIAVVVTFVLCWPAIWVLGPVEVFGRVAEFTRETGGQPHEQGTFFWGNQTADPGPLFYPVALAFRLAPITVLGLALLALCWRRIRTEDRRPVLALLAYGLGFLLMMTLGAKKLDRYVLPIFPALGVLAALGLATAYGWLREQMAAATGGAPSSLISWKATAIALVVVVAIWPAATTYPYYLSYYNPLLGGGPAAQRTVMVGNGEGLDQVAAWLNDQPGAADQWVISHSFDILQALILGSGEALRDRVPSNADYVVLYRFQIQIGHSPRVLDEYLNRHTPEHVVSINGIEYARIYRGPHQLASADPTPDFDVADAPLVGNRVDRSAAPSGSTSAAPSGTRSAAPSGTRSADWSGASPGSTVLDAARGGWQEQVKPRLRRLRTVATRLMPSGSEESP